VRLGVGCVINFFINLLPILFGGSKSGLMKSVIFTHFVGEMIFSYGCLTLHHKENLAIIFSLCGFIHLQAKVSCLTARATAGQ
jgi:hypothetical protein